MVLIIAPASLHSIEYHATGITIKIASNELPEAVKQRMAKLLQQYLASATGDPPLFTWPRCMQCSARPILPCLPCLCPLEMEATSSSALGAGTTQANLVAQVFRHAQASFLELVTSVPELLEAYESVDEHGASLRRVMINDPDSQILLTDSLSARIGSQAAASSSAGIEQAASQQTMPQSSTLADTAHADIANAAWQAEICYLERKYRTALKVALVSDQKGKHPV